MCKKNGIKIGFPGSQTNTNLSLSITGADSFVEGDATQYTASLTLSGVIGSPNTVLTVTLPAGITYVSSSDSGSFSSGVITWTLGDLIANKSVTFTINSDTPAPEYTVTGQVTSDFGNLGTTTASKDIEVESGGGGDVELRVTWATFSSPVGKAIVLYQCDDDSYGNPINISSFITFDVQLISGNLWKIGTINAANMNAIKYYQWEFDGGSYYNLDYLGILRANQNPFTITIVA